ncbi:MAG: hypothetical protein N4A46_00845 [Schleiferiaceae bacterium]|nr:hypothetical protein [Schleiferiaceae bacterium]
MSFSKQLLFASAMLLSFGCIITSTFIPSFGKAPSLLANLDSLPLSWKEMAESHISILASHHFFVNGGTPQDTFYNQRHATMNTFYVYGQNRKFFWKYYENIAVPFYQSRTVQSKFYEWAKPEYLRAYNQLPPWKKKIFIQMLNHAKSYLSNFDYEAELEKFNESPTRFCYWGPNGRRGNYGRLEAFIFRRVHNEHMSTKDMQYWANRITKDLEKQNE